MAGKVPKRVSLVVCGDPNWKDYSSIFGELCGFAVCDEVVMFTGNEIGADSFASHIANQLLFKIKSFPVPIDALYHYGNGARVKRNELLLDTAVRHTLSSDGKIAVFVFHSDYERDFNCSDIVDQATKKGIKIHFFRK